MKFSMTGQVKCGLLIQVTAWAGLTVLCLLFLTKQGNCKSAMKCLLTHLKQEVV